MALALFVTPSPTAPKEVIEHVVVEPTVKLALDAEVSPALVAESV
jgi:hypothetical protein